MLTLLDAIGVARQRYTNLILQGFSPSQLGAALSSTNPTIGSTGNQLRIRIDPWTVVPGVGILVLHMPEYYEDASEYYIEGQPDPCSLMVSRRADGIREQLTGNIDECVFNRRQNQVEIHFRMPDERYLSFGDFCLF